MLEEFSIPTGAGAGPDAIAEKMAAGIEEVREGHSGDELIGVGVGVAGLIRMEEGVIAEAPNLPGWREYPLRDRLESRLGRRVIVENDANAAALAEWRLGAGQGSRSMVYLTMSTGVGAGLILDSRLYRGAHFSAGEIGHVAIVPDGRPCSCGLRGCLEAYTSGAGLAARIREDIEAGQAGEILARAGGDPARVSARLWAEALRAGDPYSIALRDDFLDHLAMGLAGVVIGLDPECIVLGTIVEQNADLLLDDLRARVSARLWPVHADVRIEAGTLGAKRPAYAALCVAELVAEDRAAG